MINLENFVVGDFFSWSLEYGHLNIRKIKVV